MKTKEELNELREELETLDKKLADLSEEELSQITGGSPDSLTQDHGLLVGYANSLIGCPYVYGASGPDSFDSAGLVVWCYAQIGIHLPHYSESMYNLAKKRVPVSQAQPGDVLYRSGHVGISTGGANCIHAPHTGAAVCRASGNWVCALKF